MDTHCSVQFFEASLDIAGCTGIVAKGGMEVYTLVSTVMCYVPACN